MKSHLLLQWGPIEPTYWHGEIRDCICSPRVLTQAEIARMATGPQLFNIDRNNERN